MKRSPVDPIDVAIHEDIGEGDITTDFFVPENARALGRIVAREKAVVTGPTRFPGLPYERKVFFDMDRTVFQALENYQAMVKAGVR